MKKVAPTDTVFVEGSRIMCVECVHLRMSLGFWQVKVRKVAKNACQKWTKISRYFKLAIRGGYGMG